MSLISVQKRFRKCGIFKTVVRRGSVHTDLHPLVVRRYRAMQADFHLIEIDVHDFFAIGTDLGNLTVKINGIPTYRTTRNHNTDDLGFLLHDATFLSRNIVKMMKSDRLAGFLPANISIFFEKSIPQRD